MARKLKTYQTSLGFFDQAIAASSMKAALQAWGADSNLFHQGAAKESHDPDVIAAAMAKPGVVLKRPVGSDGAFSEHAELPTDLACKPKKTVHRSEGRKPTKTPPRSVDKETERSAALKFEREEKHRERERAKEKAAQRKERDRRQNAINRAQSAVDAARRKHEVYASDIRAKIENLQEQSRTEEARWRKEQAKLEDSLRRARA